MTHVMYIFTQSENSNDVYSSSVYVLESSYISKVWHEKNNINLNFHLCTKCKFEFSTSKILKFHALNLKIIYNIYFWCQKIFLSKTLVMSTYTYFVVYTAALKWKCTTNITSNECQN